MEVFRRWKKEYSDNRVPFLAHALPAPSAHMLLFYVGTPFQPEGPTAATARVSGSSEEIPFQEVLDYCAKNICRKCELLIKTHCRCKKR